MNFTTQIISHKNLDSSTLERIIKLKQCAWPYPKDSQMTWIQKNLKDDDLHIILMQAGRDVAYLNLCKVYSEINGEERSCMGIGNVCSVEKGKGYGNRLMRVTNEWLKSNEKTGLLFCHSNVEIFYSKCDWVKIDKDVCDIEGITPEVLVYAYNIPCSVLSLKYKDRFF